MISIKVCGMTDPENIKHLANLPINYIGFIFYDKSKRYVKDLNIAELNIPSHIKKVGVFVNSPLTEIDKLAKKHQLDALQIHGTESAAYCKGVKERTGLPVIKAFGVDGAFNFKFLDPYHQTVDYFLFDTKTPQYGGSGERFDWSLLQGYHLDTPYFLSGGIDPNSIKTIQDIDDDRLKVIDINSRFEVKPGLKNITEIQHALKTIGNE